MIAASLLSRNGEGPTLKHRPLFITLFAVLLLMNHEDVVLRDSELPVSTRPALWLSLSLSAHQPQFNPPYSSCLTRAQLSTEYDKASAPEPWPSASSATKLQNPQYSLFALFHAGCSQCTKRAAQPPVESQRVCKARQMPRDAQRAR